MQLMTIMNRRSTGVTRTTRKRLTEVLPHAPYEQNPKLDILRPSVVRIAVAQRSASSTGTSGTIDKNCSKSARRPSAASVFR